MIRVIAQGLVIARRDFMAVVATPTFLIFLLAPFLMLGLSIGSGMGGAYLAKGRETDRQMVVIASGLEAQRIANAEHELRTRLYGGDGPPEVHVVAPEADQQAQEDAILERKDVETTAVMRGTVERPLITHRKGSEQSARYLAMVAEEVLRAEKLGGTEVAFSHPQVRALAQEMPTKSSQRGTGSGAVVIMFMLTIMLASQSLGTLAEEKSNKVIEILAAAVPLESVFFGKLIGLFGIATVFIAFWGSLAALGLSIFPASSAFASFEPVIGLPLFILFACLYFAMAFMLLGAIFLGIGAQASTMREIQLLSLPATLFQLGMFGLAMAAAGSPGSGIATFAQIFPFSSPFAMAARGATDGAIWPHILALGWQFLWVALTIGFAAYLFRYGVLKSGVGPLTAIRRRLMGRPASR